MSLAPKAEFPTGEYLITRGSNTPEERADAERVLRQNGCRSIRFEIREGDKRLHVHGYLAAGLVFE